MKNNSSCQKYKNFTTREGLQFQSLLKREEIQRTLTKIDDKSITFLFSFKREEEALSLSCIQKHQAEQFNGQFAPKQILNHIWKIDFPNLMLMDLRSSKIDSLEVIQKMYTPQLKQLWIGGNKVLSLKSIRKVNFPKLECISFHNNILQEFRQFSEANFPKMKSLAVQFNELPGPEDLTPLLKLNTNKIINVWMERSDRITQLSMIGRIKKKYLRLQMGEEEQ